MNKIIPLFIFMSFYLQAALVGETAPRFKLKNQNDVEVSLEQFKGKFVVLEWLNHGCPFVKKHYGANNMQSLQKKYTGKGVVWLSIISSAPGKQGYVDVAGAVEQMKVHASNASMVLLDSSGDVGKKYSAKTTPHMFVIDKNQKVVYEGAIDSEASTDPSDIAGAKNYVALALDSLLSGKTVAIDRTKPYGCSVKY